MYSSVINVLTKINDAGYLAYVVGGYPRDRFMKITSVDVDICTNATPKDLTVIFNNLKISHKKYGSVTLFYNKIRFEITTFRKEKKYIDYRTPSKVEYINDLEQDLKRRDFIINTLCLNKDGEFIDLLGAKTDIDKKIIRMVGNPKKRLKEDVLRILRAVRFATTLNFKIDDNLYKYIEKYGYLVKKLSYERKKEELDKIFVSENIKYGIELLLKTGLYEHLELKNLRNIVITTSTIGIWAQLDVTDIYNFNKNECKNIKLIKELLKKQHISDLDIYYYGAYICTIAAEIKGADKKSIISRYNALPIKSIREINFNIFEYVKEKGISISNIKEIQRDLIIKIINRAIGNEKQEIIKYLNSQY